jgi:hypothetical protein
LKNQIEYITWIFLENWRLEYKDMKMMKNSMCILRIENKNWKTYYQVRHKNVLNCNKSIYLTNKIGECRRWILEKIKRDCGSTPGIYITYKKGLWYQGHEDSRFIR